MTGMVEATDDPVRVRVERQVGERARPGADRCNRLSGWFAAVVLALAIALVVFVPAAHWLAQRDIGSAGGSLLQAAGVAARDQPLAVCAGLFAVGALLGAAQNSILSRRMLKLTRQRPVTGQYASTIEKLGSDQLHVRIGAIYALERVARDSAADYPAVMGVLTAFILEHSREPWARVWPDVQAAVTVIGRRTQERDIRPIDLIGASIAFADLRGADLHWREPRRRGPRRRGPLRRGPPPRANLGGANLGGAKKKNLHGANLGGADLHGVIFAAWTSTARTSTARTSAARASTARNLGGANLHGANLHGANLHGADLTDARWPQQAAVPVGWKVDAGTRRLTVAPGPAQAS